MKKHLKIIILLSGIFAAGLFSGPFPCPFSCKNLSAAGTLGAGSNSFEFLLIPVGARETAMAAGSATAFNPNAFWWNPGALAYVERLNISLTYNKWFENIVQQRAGVTLPLKNRQVAAVNVSMLSINDIEGYDWYDTQSGNLTSKDYCLSYSQAKKFNKYIAGGISLKAIFEQLEDESNYGAALDAGFILNPFSDFWLSGGVKNAGTGGAFIEEKALLPISFFGGLGMRINKFMLLSGDVNYMDEEIFYGSGVELDLRDILFLRAGYSNFAETLSEFKLGAGWIYKDILLDYALAPYGKMGSTHRVDLTFKFGEPVLIEKLYRNAKKLYSQNKYQQALIEFNKVKSLDRNYKKIRIWLERMKKESFLEKSLEKSQAPEPQKETLNQPEPGTSEPAEE
ncbi:MAG: PorV/PorQ family protein [Elusimicrobia bacterium]|jgi:hypothetical protein|nr:PorV/PorQ family protein [Elusimicrobiota bacterium]